MKPRSARSLLWAPALLAWACDHAPVVRTGDELYAVAEDALLEVELKSQTRRAKAHRLSPEQPFAYRFEGAGGQFERCAPSAPRESALAAVRSIRVLGVLDSARAKELQRAPASAWIALDIRDIVVGGEPFHLRLMRDPRDAKRLFAQVPRYDDMLVLDAALVSLLDQRCGTEAP
jgi:hypothetical protein